MSEPWAKLQHDEFARQSEWARGIRIGDAMTPVPLWNRTEPRRKLSTPTIVMGITHMRGCQTGVMLNLLFASGEPGCLDAAWFYPVPTEVEPLDDMPLFCDRDV